MTQARFGWPLLPRRKLTPADFESAPAPTHLLGEPATERTVAQHLAELLPMFAVYTARSSGTHMGPLGSLLGQDLPEEVGRWEGEPTDLIAWLDMSQPDATTLTLRHRSATLDEARLRAFGTFALKQMGPAFRIDLTDASRRERIPAGGQRSIRCELLLRIVGRPEILKTASTEPCAVQLTFQASLSAVYLPDG